MNFLLLIIFFSKITSGETILIKPPFVDTKGFEAFVSLNPHKYKKLSNALLKNNPDPKALDRFRASYIEAQRTFFSGSISQAKKTFEALIRMKHLSDWKKPQRRLIFKSYLRRASLEELVENQTAWLKRAACYAPNLSPDPKHFAPPLVKRFHKIKKTITWIRATPSQKLNGFSIRLVNGRPWTQVIKLCPGQVRLSLFSDTYQKITKKLPAEKLEFWGPPRIAMAQGTCEKPHYRDSFGRIKQPPHVYFGDHCIRSISQPLTLPKIPKKSKITNNKSWWSKNWPWFAATAVAGAIVYANTHNSTNDSKPQPVQRDEW